MMGLFNKIPDRLIIMIYNETNLLKGYNMLLYFAGSMIMSEPTEECIIDFWTSGTLRKLPVTSTNPRFLYAASSLRESWTDKDECRKMLSDDYNLLFTETGSPLVPALASVYLNGKTNGDQIATGISEFYKSYGWEPRHSGKPSDHLGIELLFITKLVEKYLLMDDVASCNEMKKKICRFIDYFILSWIPAWEKDIREYAQSISYKGIATLIYACIEDISRILSNHEYSYNN